MQRRVPRDRPELARTLAERITDIEGLRIYVFGSRVRGDHHANSDVDVLVKWPHPPGDDVVRWWMTNNDAEFGAINAKLPGKLRILEFDDALGVGIEASDRHPIYAYGPVTCVWLDPKPRQ